jgi:hypothetical protein
MKRLLRQTCPPRELEEESWLQLLVLAYTDRAKAYEKYADNFLSTNRQVYESDTRQLGPYLPDYAASIAQMGGASSKSSLLISELYVLRAELPHFLADTPWDLRASGAVVIYGTVRLIEKDTEIGTGGALFPRRTGRSKSNRFPFECLTLAKRHGHPQWDFRMQCQR